MFRVDASSFFFLGRHHVAKHGKIPIENRQFYALRYIALEDPSVKLSCIKLYFNANLLNEHRITRRLSLNIRSKFRNEKSAIFHLFSFLVHFQKFIKTFYRQGWDCLKLWASKVEKTRRGEFCPWLDKTNFVGCPSLLTEQRSLPREVISSVKK